VAAGLEDLLGFYSPRRFGPETEATFPEEWRRAGTQGGRGRFFQSTFVLFDFGLFMLLVAVLSRSDWVRAWVSALLRAAKL
jgi:hypothetical protein